MPFPKPYPKTPHTKLFHLLLPSALLALSPGCGGKVVLEDSNQNPSSSSSGGAGASSSSSSGSAQCGQTYDRLDFRIQDPKGQEYACNGMVSNPMEILEFTGELIGQKGETLVFETCPPTADCPSIPYTISIEAAGFTFGTLPKGAFFKVSAQIQQDWACTQRIIIQNAPSWGGVPNPISKEEFIIFAGADGTTEVLPGTPFIIEAQALGCYPDAPPDCGGPREDYQLLFTSTVYEDHETTVSMGNTKEWSPFSPTARPLLVRNLRSYSSGACDDYWNWAYWMAFPPTVD